MNVTVVTGTRAEYGIWTPVLHAIRRSKKLRLQLVVTGTHLLRQFGSTARRIKRDGFIPAATVPMYRSGDTPADSLSRGTANLAKAFGKLSPDIVLVLGDRLEILAAAQAALCRQIPIGHVHGGESAPGQFDEQIRHAVTKLAHLHFTATPTAARRIIQMGENPQHVHMVGAPALDVATAAAKALREKAMATRGAGSSLLVLHPMSPDTALESRRAATIISALHSAYGTIEVIGPNNDPGFQGILSEYARHDPARFTFHPSVSQGEFWGMLWTAPFLIGNSSAGIIEAATFGTPVINIGDRQAGRERSGNVIDVPCKSAAIRAAIKKATSPAFVQRVRGVKNIYGDGNASGRIVAILERVQLEQLLRKKFFDI